MQLAPIWFGRVLRRSVLYVAATVHRCEARQRLRLHFVLGPSAKIALATPDCSFSAQALERSLTKESPSPPPSKKGRSRYTLGCCSPDLSLFLLSHKSSQHHRPRPKTFNFVKRCLPAIWIYSVPAHQVLPQPTAPPATLSLASRHLLPPTTGLLSQRKPTSVPPAMMDLPARM